MISVTILTKNCQETLEETLKSLQDFQEVLLYDTGSTDSTLTIAGKFSNVKVIQGSFIGFGPTHNVASTFATHDWILSIDSDEVLTSELYRELITMPLDPGCVYAIQRYNYFNGKHIKWCAGWHPDWVRRLYHRKMTAFNEAAVHEQVLIKGLREIRLRSPLRHTPYRTTHDFLAKMQTYSTLFAKQNSSKKQSSLLKAVVHSSFAFFKSYILKRGFLGGREGFIISLYNSHTTFYKYLKLGEFQFLKHVYKN
jgi:glycosyltransferase involved in cell wall biosynthesis